MEKASKMLKTKIKQELTLLLVTEMALLLFKSVQSSVCFPLPLGLQRIQTQQCYLYN